MTNDITHLHKQWKEDDCRNSATHKGCCNATDEVANDDNDKDVVREIVSDSDNHLEKVAGFNGVSKDIATTKKHDDVPWKFKIIMSVKKTRTEKEDERDE